MKYYLLVGVFIFTYASFLLWVTQSVVLSDQIVKPMTALQGAAKVIPQQVLGVADETMASAVPQPTPTNQLLKKGSFVLPLAQKDYQFRFTTSYFQTFDPIVIKLLNSEGSDSNTLVAKLTAVETVLEYPKLFQPQTKQLVQKMTSPIVKKVLDTVEQDEQSPLWYAVTTENLRELQKKGYSLDASQMQILKEILAYFAESKDLREKVMGGYGVRLLDAKKEFPEELVLNSSYDTDILSFAISAHSLKQESSQSGTIKDALHNKAIVKEPQAMWPKAIADRSDLIATALAIKAISVSEGNLDLAKKGATYLESVQHDGWWEDQLTSALVIQSLAGLSEKLYDPKPNFTLKVIKDKDELYTGTIKSLNTRIPVVSIPKVKIASGGATLSVIQEGVGDLYTLIQ